MDNKQLTLMKNLQDEPDYSALSDCTDSCQEILSFCKLIDSMAKDIIALEEEMVRWRQALLRYLSPRDSENLKSDIYANMAARYSTNEAYQIYMNTMRGGQDPMESNEHVQMMSRLRDGIDDTSVVL